MDRSSAYVRSRTGSKIYKSFHIRIQLETIIEDSKFIFFPSKIQRRSDIGKTRGEGGEEPGSIRATTSVRGRKRQGQDADRNGIWERGSKRSPSLIHIGGIAKLRLVVRGGSLAMA